MRAVSKRYGVVEALKGISFEMPAGSRTAIVGASGSGKTTLLRVIAGFEIPDEGELFLDGVPLVRGDAMVPAHRRGIGYVAQDGALFPHLTVGRNIAFGMDKDDGQAGRIAVLMELVGLSPDMASRWPHELSGGQQQRVALARALARRPKLMLLDEPFSALDAGLRAATRKAVARVLSDAGIATILVTHDEAEALSFADLVAVMRQGQLAQVASPREVYLRPQDRTVAEFIGQAVILPANAANGHAICALGEIAVDSDLSGAVHVLVRPEQLRLVAGPCGDGTKACTGEVAELDFGGAFCFVTVKLDADRESGRTILVQCSSGDMPALGQRVRLELAGKAHVLKS